MLPLILCLQALPLSLALVNMSQQVVGPLIHGLGGLCGGGGHCGGFSEGVERVGKVRRVEGGESGSNHIGSSWWYVYALLGSSWLYVYALLGCILRSCILRSWFIYVWYLQALSKAELSHVNCVRQLNEQDHCN